MASNNSKDNKKLETSGTKLYDVTKDEKSNAGAENDSKTNSDSKKADSTSVTTNEEVTTRSQLRTINKLKTRGIEGLAKKLASPVEKVTKTLAIAVTTIVVVIIAITLYFTLSVGNFTKGDIVALNLYQTRTAKDINDNVVQAQDEYKAGDPILGEWKYKAIPNGETRTFSWRVVKDGQNDEEGQPVQVRQGTIPVTGSEDESSEGGVRYVSVVSSARNALAAGKYICEIKVSTDADSTDAQLVARHYFTVTE